MFSGMAKKTARETSIKIRDATADSIQVHEELGVFFLWEMGWKICN